MVNQFKTLDQESSSFKCYAECVDRVAGFVRTPIIIFLPCLSASRSQLSCFTWSKQFQPFPKTSRLGQSRIGPARAPVRVRVVMNSRPACWELRYSGSQE